MNQFHRIPPYGKFAFIVAEKQNEGKEKQPQRITPCGCFCMYSEKILAGKAPVEIKDRASIAKFDKRLALLPDTVTGELKMVNLSGRV